MSIHDSDNFYRSIPESSGFSSAFDARLYRPVPDDWIVAATDVTNSTVAIEEGHYKDVTIAGAVGTIALANYLGSLDFPFFFGGDGMVFLLPGRHADATIALLGDAKDIVHQVSGLGLRAGIVPVSALYEHGATLEIGRVRVTPRYVQAVARGDAMALVDRMLKQSDPGGMTFVRTGNTSGRNEPAPESAPVRADFRGFSCRWEDIPSRRGETISLIATAAPGTDDDTILRRVQQVIYGNLDNPDGAHPLAPETQHTSGAGMGARAEARFLARKNTGIRYAFHRIMITLEVLMVRFTIWSRIPVRAMGKRVSEIPQDNIRNSDVQKLDGTLKMVLSVTPAERERIINELDRLQQQRRIVYGYHRSDRAVMTCLIHINHSDEVHFVDAADGGYAMAARMLKTRMLS